MKQKNVLVTGGKRGIGLSIVERFSKQGMNVYSPSREELNLSSIQSINNFIENNRNLKIDILVNNAGINTPQSILEMDNHNWNSTLMVNLTAPLLLIKEFTSSMMDQKWGRIVNISSILSIVGKKDRSAYSAAKSALNALTRTAAIELGIHNILVNSICPGYVDTDLTRINNTPEDLNLIKASIPLNRLAHTNEISNVVSFLCSEDCTYITGQTIVVDGGFICQ